MIFVWTEHGVPLNRPIVTKIKIYCRAVGLHHYYWLWEKSAVKIFSSWLWSRQSPPCLIQYNVTLASALFHSIIISMSLLFILLPEAHRKNISNTKYLDYFALHIKIKKKRNRTFRTLSYLYYLTGIICSTLKWMYRHKLACHQRQLWQIACYFCGNPDIVTWQWKTPLLCNSVSAACTGASSYDSTCVKSAVGNTYRHVRAFQNKISAYKDVSRGVLWTPLTSFIVDLLSLADLT